MATALLSNEPANYKKCRICHRRLYDDDSRKLGIGPACLRKLGYGKRRTDSGRKTRKLAKPHVQEMFPDDPGRQLLLFVR